MGEYIHSVDEKGRVIMPLKFREQLSQTFYITKSIDRCLFVYDEEEWRLMYEKMRSLKLTSEKARRFTRNMFGPARELTVDKQGRIIIPQNLRDYAGIDKEVVITGVATKIEIWSKEVFESNRKEEEEDFYDLIDEYEELDI